MARDICVICMDDLSADHPHVLGCNHAFHSKCLIGWFQRGHLSCPTCRTDAQHHDRELPALGLSDRALYIRRTMGRRASAPPELKRILSDLRAAEGNSRQKKREYREFKRTNSETLKRQNALRRQVHHARVRERRLVRVLGLYQSPDLTLPALSITHYS
jgi:hypothetical protein